MNSKTILILALIVSICAVLLVVDAMYPHTRKIAFDNAYGVQGPLVVWVRADEREEKRLTATCDPTTCIVLFKLEPGEHTLAIAVEQDSKRSTYSTITAKLPSRFDKARADYFKGK